MTTGQLNRWALNQWWKVRMLVTSSRVSPSLASARGDDAAAEKLQARAAAIAERDRASPDALRGAAVTT